MFKCRIQKEIAELKIQIQFEKSYNEINEELRDLKQLLMTIEYNMK